MNIEKKNLDKARELLAELERLEEVDDVLGNYDARAYAVFRTCHNMNAIQYLAGHVEGSEITNKVYIDVSEKFAFEQLEKEL